MKKTQRGLVRFGQFTGLPRGIVRVQESSRTLEGPHCWIFQDMYEAKNPDSAIEGVEIDVQGALWLVGQLDAFICAANRGDLTEKVKS